MSGGMPILPVDAYTSRAWFDREQERIFSRTWACAGFAEDLTEPGQYRSVQAGLNSILVVIGADAQPRAFHNICRHRGTQLIRAVGRAAALRCPYHDWTYDLDGRLVGVPRRADEFPDLDPSCLSLEHGPSARIGEAAVRRHQEIVLEWLGEAGAEPPAGRGGGVGGRGRLGHAPSGSAGL